MPFFNVFKFSDSFGTTHFAVADWDDSEVNAVDGRPKPIAEFRVSQQHKAEDQAKLARTFCAALNKQRAKQQEVPLEF